MFGKFMNNYYYGKSGKGDYTPDDLPRTRWQLFMEMLRTRLSALCRLNLIYMLPWLPAIIVLGMFYFQTMSMLSVPGQVDEQIKQINTGIEQADGSWVIETEDGSITYTAEEVQQLRDVDAVSDEQFILDFWEDFEYRLMMMLIWLIPCIAITGPFTAGVSYVTRNWARDEHAFLWSDMKDAMKENWKPALALSAITSVLPLLIFLCWTYYGQLTVDSAMMEILRTLGQIIPVMAGIIWSLAITYAYPMLVTYQMTFRQLIRNCLILAVGRLPQNVGVRLLHCVPALLGLGAAFFFAPIWAPLLLAMYYVLFGYSLSRFITASFTNAQFDRYINSRIEGAEVNRGLADEDEDEDDDEDDERELKPWENGYASQDGQN